MSWHLCFQAHLAICVAPRIWILQVFELMVPLDKPEVLEKTLDVLAQFATAIRCGRRFCPHLKHISRHACILVRMTCIVSHVLAVKARVRHY